MAEPLSGGVIGLLDEGAVGIALFIFIEGGGLYCALFHFGWKLLKFQSHKWVIQWRMNGKIS